MSEVELKPLFERLNKIAEEVDRDAVGLGKPEIYHVSRRRELLSYLEPLLFCVLESPDSAGKKRALDSIEGTLRGVSNN